MSRAAKRVEILGLTPHALWLLVDGQEHMLDFGRFPWFREATMQALQKVELRFDHLRWTDLDIDLHIDSLAHPERFPLVARSSGS